MQAGPAVGVERTAHVLPDEFVAGEGRHEIRARDMADVVESAAPLDRGGWPRRGPLRDPREAAETVCPSPTAGAT
jgi:hypothetical protein